jgi:antitoxin component YwqK of YwqJK toxin-antitoxin module
MCYVLLILLVACKNESKAPAAPQSEEIKENYGTGEKSRVYTRVNGKIEGKMIDYYPSGALKGERLFEDDKQHGKTTIYYESGAIKEVQYYDKGLRNGGDTIFYESGKVQYVSAFKDEKKNGYLRKWNDGGKLIYEAKFDMDSLVEVEGKKIK